MQRGALCYIPPGLQMLNARWFSTDILSLRDFPGIMTQGMTINEVVENINDDLNLYMQEYNGK